MRIITLETIERGAIFIYPTDTIYGIGCNALNSKAVIRLRKIKEQYDRPVSIIAPSKKWIMENCEVNEGALSKLPGPYTLIVKLKTKVIAKEVNLGSGTVGVRMPNHWITRQVAKFGFPIVTTSVNKTGNQFMTSFDNLDAEIAKKVDFIVYDGKKEGHPSTIINLINHEILKR